MLSLNCLILGQASEKSLTENIGETYEDDSGVVIEFSKFTVCNFKEKLFRREEVKVIVQNTGKMDLWKVDGKKVNEEENNLKEFTESDIKDKLGGEKMIPQFPLEDYFKAKETNIRDIHVFIVSTSTDYYPPKKRRRIIKAQDVPSMTWKEQSEAFKSGLNEPPIIIDNGVYSLDESEFKKFVTSGTFVDKSLFIMEFMIFGKRSNLIIRPRRFGKSTNLSMLETFLSTDYPPLNYVPDVKTSLFGNLKVARFEWFAKLYYKQWPVIHISFKDLGSESWELMLDAIKERISNLYEKYQYLIDILPKSDKEKFVSILNNKTTGVALLNNALSNLARYLNKCFGKSSIILIDEYDWPMENARGFYDNVHDFFKTMYSSVAKENTYVDKVLFVGTLPLGQTSFLSGFNNVVVYPMHEKPSCSGRAIFSDTFGFTENEIKYLLEEKKQNEKLDELRLYYNGYRTSTGVHIYNPHSVISYLDKDEIDNYWINSGSTKTLVEILKKCGSGVKDRLENIIHSHSFCKDKDVVESVGQDESVDLGSESWELMLGKIKERISDLYGKHQYLIDILPEYNKKDFVAVLNRETTGVALWSNALSCLARYLNETMYSSIAKENRNVDKILFVGTFPLRQSSFLSGLNNVVAYPMHERPNHSGRAIFSDTFGFTEEEIKHLLEKKHQNKKLKELRLYYNGYRTSTGVHIYNPHSVISCLEKNEIDNYWINSGSATTFDQDVIESVGQDESVVMVT
ncbi:DUF1703-domain-containing protein [Rhizophagus irregularis]|uniref:DUF1703-domain-containing protein n=1 Tax=Rhizophagus irregularis TaxID=588596 RepID=A0A2N0PHE4_9GLOM|nr:DUF1703-domain-containing protein [Rhizophagus irregularis]